MKYSAKQYAQALHQAVQEVRPEDQDRVLDNFVNLLKENSDLKMIDSIEAEFFRIARESNGVKVADVTSVHKLSPDEEQQIITELNKRVGGQVELRKKIDEGLIGGIIIKIDDELIDGSVRKTLQTLKNQLIN